MINDCFSCAKKDCPSERVHNQKLFNYQFKPTQNTPVQLSHQKSNQQPYKSQKLPRTASSTCILNQQKEQPHFSPFKFTDYPLVSPSSHHQPGKPYQYPHLKMSATNFPSTSNPKSSLSEHPFDYQQPFSQQKFNGTISAVSQVSYSRPLTQQNFRTSRQSSVNRQHHFHQPLDRNVPMRTPQSSEWSHQRASSSVYCSNQPTIVSSTSQVSMSNISAADSRVVYKSPFAKVKNTSHKQGKPPLFNVDYTAQNKPRASQPIVRNQRDAITVVNNSEKKLAERRLQIIHQENEVLNLLREQNKKLHGIIKNEYLPMKAAYQKIIKQQQERQYLVTRLEWKIRQLKRQMFG